MDLLKTYRIKEWIYFLGLPLLGYFLQENMTSYHLAKVLIVAFLLLSYAFSLNDFFDKRLNENKIIIPLIPLCLLIFCLFYFNHIKIIMILLFLLISTTYSLPKIRLKSVPFICTLWNVVGFSLLFLLGINIISREAIILIFVFLFLLFVAQLMHELAHQTEDRNAHIKTTALFLGEEKTKQLCCIGLVLPSLISFLFNIFLAILISIYSIIFLILIWRRPAGKLREEFRTSGIIIGVLILTYLYVSRRDF
jgi:4-hydroxybenzoate polyprenyltransferase